MQMPLDKVVVLVRQDHLPPTAAPGTRVGSWAQKLGTMWLDVIQKSEISLTQRGLSKVPVTVPRRPRKELLETITNRYQIVDSKLNVL
jgi:hypothetical protein